MEKKIADIVFSNLSRNPKVNKLVKLGFEESDMAALESLYVQAWESVGVELEEVKNNFGSIGILLGQDYKREEAKQIFIELLS